LGHKGGAAEGRKKGKYRRVGGGGGAERGRGVRSES